MLSSFISVPLIELPLYGQLHYYCTTSADVQYDGRTWRSLDTNPPIVSAGAGGVKTASLQLPDYQFALNRALVSMGIANVFGTATPVKIYAGQDVAGTVTARVLFKGYINQVTAFGPILGLALKSVDALNDFFPKFSVRRPHFKYLIENGTVERWNGRTFTFEAPP